MNDQTANRYLLGALTGLASLLLLPSIFIVENEWLSAGAFVLLVITVVVESVLAAQALKSIFRSR